jgi:hypothetical protein
MPFQDLITLVANIALTLTFVIGLVFGIAQVRAASRDRRERLTLETIRNFQSREFAELLQFVTTAKFPKSEEEMNSLPVNQQVIIIQFAQQMESLGILVAEDLINLDLVDKTLGVFVTTAWKKYKVMFSAIRERDPFLGEYFQWLAERIAERAKQLSRKPFYLNQGLQK